MAKAIAVSQGSTPEAPSPMTMPIVAEEEWIKAVISAAIMAQPTTPKKFVASSPEMIDITSGMVFNGLSPPVIRFRP